MKPYLAILFVALMMTTSFATAQESITVTATDNDISNNLDLKAVASVFGESKDLEEFEKKLNDYDNRISNLDLNGDGEVDYLRVIETAEGNKHLVVIQAILAKDIYQDVASIYVEKDETTQKTSVQVVGDEYIYGTNYVIEPVYIQVPVIYDYFWRPAYTYWYSPYYWGYYPGYWHPYSCWLINDYWHHIYAYHHHHPYCSFRYTHAPRPGYDNMRRGLSRNDYGVRHPENSFSSRNTATGMRNTRDIQTARSTGSSTTRTGVGASTASRTFNSANVRAASATRGVTSGGTRMATDATTSRSISTTVNRTPSGSRTGSSNVATRSASASETRSSVSAGTATRSSSSNISSGTSPSVTRSSSSSVSRSSNPSVSRSSTSSSVNRSSSSSASRPSSSVSHSSASSSRSSSSSVYSSGGSSRSSSGGSHSSGSSSRSGSSNSRR